MAKSNKQPNQSTPETPRQALGKLGERLAADYLVQNGYTLVGANWRCPEGEIDLIARKDDLLVFVEVRTRRSGTENAFASINPRKREILARSAHLYLAAQEIALDTSTDQNSAWRVDVIAVGIPRRGAPVIEHVEDALDW